jgi:pimeloyl-ACP methyl ester carboxylesterase
MMRLVEQDVLVGGLRLRVYRTGTDKPPLVFAHGITDSGLCFTPIAEQLADDWEIVLYDARGHGKSDQMPPGSTPLDRARDLAAIVEALGLHKPGLLGHSMGGATVALCAGLFSQLPGCLILEDPQPPETLVAPVEEHPVFGRTQWREWAAADKAKSIEELVETSRQRDPSWPEAERAPWARAKQQVSLTIFDEGYVDDVATVKLILSQITCPTLLMTADPDLAMFAATATADLVASLPSAHHVIIPGAGHNIRREQPALYLDAVRDFLKGLS